MSKVVALIGNQNSGKSTLFNVLTGSNQHVGNFPGVTVERKEGVIKKVDDAILVDLPGIYSLTPYSDEEIVTRNFILDEKPSLIINIVDATNIQRNLYLTMQLLEMKVPMIVVLNMMDELERSGCKIDVMTMQERLGVKVLPISASHKTGIKELIHEIQFHLLNHTTPKLLDFCDGEIHRSIHAASHLVEEQAKKIGYDQKFVAIKLIERDPFIEKKIQLSKEDKHVIEHLRKSIEKSLNMDIQAAIVDMRYKYIEVACALTCSTQFKLKSQSLSDRLDKVFTHKWFALPIFLGIMFVIFYLTFGPIGGTLQTIIEEVLTAMTTGMHSLLVDNGTSPWVVSLVIDGALAGVSSILSFVPLIVVLFFFLSLLEDSGYMARVAYIMDKLLRKLGLSGQSFVPMILGFGCSVPAIFATRTLPSKRDRLLTIILIPFFSCTAKLPVYALFTSVFFVEYQAFVMIALYIFGILMAVVSALILKKAVFSSEEVSFVMELPNYRLPQWKNVRQQLWLKAKDFIERAFTFILLASIALWFLNHFTFQLQYTTDSSISILANIASTVGFIFAPLGFNDYRIVTALVAGLSAKEAVVSTLQVLTQSANLDSLMQILSQLFTPLSAMSFLIFTLLYTPCVAAIAAIKKEVVTWKLTGSIILYQLAIAWVMSFLFYQTARLLIG